jgi:hypothetical protein
MAIPCNTLDLENKKFVECPTGSGQVSVRTKICQDTGETLKVEFGTSDTTPTISNPTLTTATTEQSIALQNGLKQLIVRVQSPINARLQYAFISGESGTNFMTIPAGTSLSLKDVNFNSKTLYIQSDKNNTVVEILQLT